LKKAGYPAFFIGCSFYLQLNSAGGKMSRLLNGQQVMAGRKP
jgi:hypothetical protein